MEKKNKPKTIKFRISNIKVTNFFIDNSIHYWELSKEHEYTFEVNSDIKYNKEEKSIATIVTSNLFLEKEKNTRVCSLTVIVVYVLEDYDGIVKHSESKVDIPIEVIKLLLSTHIAMVRGILYEKTQGSFLQNVYLPPVNINNLVKE